MGISLSSIARPDSSAYLGGDRSQVASVRHRFMQNVPTHSDRQRRTIDTAPARLLTRCGRPAAILTDTLAAPTMRTLEHRPRGTGTAALQRRSGPLITRSSDRATRAGHHYRQLNSVRITAQPGWHWSTDIRRSLTAAASPQLHRVRADPHPGWMTGPKRIRPGDGLLRRRVSAGWSGTLRGLTPEAGPRQTVCPVP
jgi:hypothetical protein